MQPMKLLTDTEQRIANLLGECFTLYKTLPVYHPSDADNFLRAVHAAQNIVLARPGYASQPQQVGLWESRQKELAPPPATTAPAGGLYYQLMDVLIEARTNNARTLSWHVNIEQKDMLMSFQHKTVQS